MNDDYYIENALKLLRLQKHDMLNYLQVVHGYLQLNKVNDAEERLKTIINELQLKGSVLKIVHPKVVIMLSSQMEKFFNMGVSLVIHCIGNLDSISKEKEGLLIELLDKVWDIFVSILSKESFSDGQIYCVIEEDDSFNFSGINFSEYLLRDKIELLNQLAKNIGYKITFSGENLIIGKVTI